MYYTVTLVSSSVCDYVLLCLCQAVCRFHFQLTSNKVFQKKTRALLSELSGPHRTGLNLSDVHSLQYFVVVPDDSRSAIDVHSPALQF